MKKVQRTNTNWKCSFNDFNIFRQKYNFWPIPVFWRALWSVIPFYNTLNSWILDVDIVNVCWYPAESCFLSIRPPQWSSEANIWTLVGSSQGISGNNGVCYWGLLGWVWGCGVLWLREWWHVVLWQCLTLPGCWQRPALGPSVDWYISHGSIFKSGSSLLERIWW